MLRVYGIKNCDTVKKTLKFLDQEKTDYDFIDFKKQVPTKEEILNWKKVFGDWPVNKRGRTFKSVAEDFEAASDSEKIKIIQEKTSTIRRPITTDGKSFCFGHDEAFLKKLV